MSSHMEWDQEDIQYQPVIMSRQRSCENENCDGSCGIDHIDEVSSDAVEADSNDDHGMAGPFNNEDWDEIGVEELEDVAEMQELLMEENSSDDDDSDSEPEELPNVPMENDDISDDD